jgi:endonuclease/exonuclease/phosphatase family metal-dependent hydrolase
LQNTLSIATFNMHKGFTHFNARFALQSQRELLRKLHADVIFLQEVQDVHIKHNKRFNAWSTSGQLEYLADSIWSDYAYGKNAIYPAGHHGNALLSKFPITKSYNQDISAHTYEQRGMLHCEIEVPDWDTTLHAVCLHLGLLAPWRRQQLVDIAHYIEQHIPADAPLIVAGDFNDWSMRAGHLFANRLKLHEVFEHHLGKPARSFPAWLPMLRMDRIYVRNFQIKQVQVHAGPHFLNISDHAILTAELIKT